MYERLKKRKWEITFVIIGIFTLYVFPVIALHTMAGDKTDILMGLAFGFVPLGWLLISLLYGFLTKKILVASCCGAILCIPFLFIRIITGDTVAEKVYAVFIIMTICFLITTIGSFFGCLLKKGIYYLRKR